MKIKNVFTFLSLFIVCAIIGILLANTYLASISKSVSDNASTTTIAARFVNSTIFANGSVTAQNQAKLNFQTGGKLVYLPFKEGDAVYTGQTIAQLDTYQLKRQLTAALNTYRSTRDTFDQTHQNAQNNQLQNSQIPSYLNVEMDNKMSAVDDAVKRILDQNQATLDNSVINVELANYAMQLSTLSSPLKGIITHEDVSVSGVNITTATTFTVADPDTMVFRANVPMVNIYYISEGSTVTLAIDGIQNKISGTVVKIFPSKVILPNGLAVYTVDIASDELKKYTKLDQTGTAIISTNSQNMALVPVWTVLDGKYVWIEKSGVPDLHQITVGKTHGNEIEITSGLTPSDKIIVDPRYISTLTYKVL